MTVLLLHAGGAILCRILTSSAGVSLAPFEDQDIVRLIDRSRDESWETPFLTETGQREIESSDTDFPRDAGDWRSLFGVVGLSDGMLELGSGTYGAA